eukprot:12673-Heterococcus_DN1.PRE.2
MELVLKWDHTSTSTVYLPRNLLVCSKLTRQLSNFSLVPLACFIPSHRDVIVAPPLSASTECCVALRASER